MAGKNIGEVTKLTIAESLEWFSTLEDKLSENHKKIAERALKLSKAIDFQHGEVQALSALGSYYYDTGARKKSMPIFENAMNIILR